MPRYAVNLRQWQLMETMVVVDAGGPAEARRIAKQQPDEGEWCRAGSFGSITVNSCRLDQ